MQYNLYCIRLTIRTLQYSNVSRHSPFGGVGFGTKNWSLFDSALDINVTNSKIISK